MPILFINLQRPLKQKNTLSCTVHSSNYLCSEHTVEDAGNVPGVQRAPGVEGAPGVRGGAPLPYSVK